MNSFNSYGQTTKNFGGNTPVWLGTVKPIPVGAMFGGSVEEYPFHIPAGTPVVYIAEQKTFTVWRPSSEATPSGYLYNDIYVEEDPVKTGGMYFITGAIVMYHSEGLLIDRTGFGEHAERLQAAIPGVLLVRDSE